uniref:Sumo ligase n=1 Tax=Rhizophora mucronata TaxID=61149 RepID=A0A2P2MH70_RHIMU
MTLSVECGGGICRGVIVISKDPVDSCKVFSAVDEPQPCVSHFNFLQNNMISATHGSIKGHYSHSFSIPIVKKNPSRCW